MFYRRLRVDAFASCWNPSDLAHLARADEPQPSSGSQQESQIPPSSAAPADASAAEAAAPGKRPRKAETGLHASAMSSSAPEAAPTPAAIGAAGAPSESEQSSVSVLAKSEKPLDAMRDGDGPSSGASSQPALSASPAVATGPSHAASSSSSLPLPPVAPPTASHRSRSPSKYLEFAQRQPSVRTQKLLQAAQPRIGKLVSLMDQEEIDYAILFQPAHPLSSLEDAHALSLILQGPHGHRFRGIAYLDDSMYLMDHVQQPQPQPAPTDGAGQATPASSVPHHPPSLAPFPSAAATAKKTPGPGSATAGAGAATADKQTHSHSYHQQASLMIEHLRMMKAQHLSGVRVSLTPWSILQKRPSPSGGAVPAPASMPPASTGHPTIEAPPTASSKHLNSDSADKSALAPEDVWMPESTGTVPDGVDAAGCSSDMNDAQALTQAMSGPDMTGLAHASAPPAAQATTDGPEAEAEGKRKRSRDERSSSDDAGSLEEDPEAARHRLQPETRAVAGSLMPTDDMSDEAASTPADASHQESMKVDESFAARVASAAVPVGHDTENASAAPTGSAAPSFVEAGSAELQKPLDEAVAGEGQGLHPPQQDQMPEQQQRQPQTEGPEASRPSPQELEKQKQWQLQQQELALHLRQQQEVEMEMDRRKQLLKKWFSILEAAAKEAASQKLVFHVDIGPGTHLGDQQRQFIEHCGKIHGLKLVIDASQVLSSTAEELDTMEPHRQRSSQKPASGAQPSSAGSCFYNLLALSSSSKAFMMLRSIDCLSSPAEAYPFKKIERKVTHVMDAYGMHRVLYGSGIFSGDRRLALSPSALLLQNEESKPDDGAQTAAAAVPAMPLDYFLYWKVFDGYAQPLREEQKDLVFGKTAGNVYGFRLTPHPQL